MVTHAARLANFEVHALWRKWCFQMSWEKLTSHSVMPCWFGRMLTCENSFDSKPQSKLFLSLFDKCHFTCLPCSRTFWKTTSKWFCKEKRNVRNIWKKIEANYAGFYGKYPLSCYHGQGDMCFNYLQFDSERKFEGVGEQKNCANLQRRLCQKIDTHLLPYHILAISTYQDSVTCSIFDGMPAVVPSCGFECYVFKWI